MLVLLTHKLVLLQALFPFTFDYIRHHHFPPHLIFYHDVSFDLLSQGPFTKLRLCHLTTIKHVKYAPSIMGKVLIHTLALNVLGHKSG